MLGADARVLGARIEGGVDPSDSERASGSGSVRFGRVDSIHLSVFGEGRRSLEPVLSRLVRRDSWDAPDAGFYAAQGFSAGGEALVPWTHWLATSVAVARDLTHEEWLSMSGALGYRHPCGCLATLGWVGHRLGREGIDVQVSVDLMP